MMNQKKDSLLSLSPFLQKLLFFICVALCLSTLFNPAIALLTGLILAQVSGNPYKHMINKVTGYLLKASVIGLGFGMNFYQAVEAGKEGLSFTVVSISCTLLFGYLLGRLLRTNKETSYLVSVGTAICGGSAIAAIAPVIDANERQISVALGIIFILNSVALFVYPPLGHLFNLTQQQFGMWCAIAIHDTSSVVGAASRYGSEATAVATTVKLARALFIIPLALASIALFKSNKKTISIPYFILFFILAMLANTYLPIIAPISPYVVATSKSGLTLTLFLIGSGLSRSNISEVGFRPFLQGTILWISISALSLSAILYF